MPLDESKNTLFPVFLKLEGLRVLVVGGGKVATEKLQALLRHSPKAAIIIVAKEIGERANELISTHPSIKIYKREFQVDDLDWVDIAIVAVNDHKVASIIRDAAHKKNILVNVVDTPDLCDFYLGSIVQKGSLKIAISTNGKSPTAAKRLREMLEKILPDEIDEVIDNLHAIRKKMHTSFQEKVNQLNEITKNLIK